MAAEKFEKFFKKWRTFDFVLRIMIIGGFLWTSAFTDFYRQPAVTDRSLTGFTFLLSVNHNAVPTIIPVAVFEEFSGETVDKYDCVGVMTLEGFQRFYTSWLVWNVEDPKRCSLSQMWESCQQ